MLGYYFKKYGLINFILKCCETLWRNHINIKEILFYFRVENGKINENQRTIDINVERFDNFESIPGEYLFQIYKNKDKVITDEFFNRFFKRGAVLWLAMLNNEVAGFHWSIGKEFDGFTYFPMTSEDVFLVSSEVFPTYRGKGINPEMIKKIVSGLHKEGINNFYIACKTWNKENLKSVPKAGFVKIGSVIKISLFGKDIVIWDKHEY